MMLRWLVVSGFGLLLVVGLTTAAQGHWGGPWGYTGYVAESPPYFAMHPPVYYGLPIARPYGLSPYPWPPAVPVVVQVGPAPTSSAPVAPLRIRNPFVDASEAAPLRIRNPYLNGSEPPAAGSQDTQPTSPPQLPSAATAPPNLQ